MVLSQVLILSILTYLAVILTSITLGDWLVDIWLPPRFTINRNGGIIEVAESELKTGDIILSWPQRNPSLRLTRKM